MKNSTIPERPLSVDFTAMTLERAMKARRRSVRRLYLKELFTMRKNLLKQPAGALIVTALVVLGGAGVYAATNWFNGSVQVTSTDASIMTVDLSKCASALPPGIEPNRPLDKVKFKILGTPHISASDLEEHLTANCEFANVIKAQRAAAGYDVAVTPALVRSVDLGKGTITLAFSWGPWSHEATYTLTPGAKVLDKGAPATLGAFKSGDFVTFAYKIRGVTLESVDPYAGLTAIDGLFKTQFDTRLVVQDNKHLYSDGNIMPLDLYTDNSINPSY
jgi:hypothetical protein